jgi:hypothetical protein
LLHAAKAEIDENIQHQVLISENKKELSARLKKKEQEEKINPKPVKGSITKERKTQ